MVLQIASNLGSIVNDGIDVVFSAGNCGQFCPDRRCGETDRGPGHSIWGANSHPRVLTFGASHQYLDNPAGQAHGGSFGITATVTDKDGDSGTGSTSVDVENVAPANVVLTPSPATIRRDRRHAG